VEPASFNVRFANRGLLAARTLDSLDSLELEPLVAHAYGAIVNREPFNPLLQPKSAPADLWSIIPFGIALSASIGSL